MAFLVICTFSTYFFRVSCRELNKPSNNIRMPTAAFFALLEKITYLIYKDTDFWDSIPCHKHASYFTIYIIQFNLIYFYLCQLVLFFVHSTPLLICGFSSTIIMITEVKIGTPSSRYVLANFDSATYILTGFPSAGYSLAGYALASNT